MRTRISRRDLLLTGGAAVAAIAGRVLFPRVLPGVEFHKTAHNGAALGHRLRTHDFPEPSEFSKQKTVIAGGGIAGLSAAYHLHQAGDTDFSLWELERSTGGNSIYGESPVSRFPWGAHYLPLPSLDNKPLLKFLEYAGAIRGYENGLPIYEELYACHDPQERCFDGKSWSSGLLPAGIMSEEDNAQIKRFSELMDTFRGRKGRDGKLAFDIPVRYSSRDEKFLALDKISMAEFLERHGFNSQVLQWYVDYCMRDDFGTKYKQVSAWAGVHYYAARGGRAANLDEHSVLTWPEGNGWLADKLAAPVKEHLHANHVVFRIAPKDTGANVDVFDVQSGKSRRIDAKNVIYAAPRYTAPRVIQNYSIKGTYSYSTWFIANVTLSRLPPSFKNAPLSWDNIRYESDLLGYVNATHQDIKRFSNETVVTVYWPISAVDNPREWARNRSEREWRDDVIGELEVMHPGITESVRAVETKIWGHAMIQPLVGFFAGEAFKNAEDDFGAVRFAHSDMSGISIFENAFEAGRLAARKVRL